MKKIIWIGDSTVAFNRADTFPQTGMGQEFNRYCKQEIAVLDFAQNGASTKSFYNGGWFAPALAAMEEGDFLFIQFGHNDEKPDEERRTEPYTTYQEWLLRYINIAREHGVHPVLITPLSRRLFREDGTIESSHGEYPEAMTALGRQEGVPVIPLTEKSRLLYEQTGDQPSRRWFMYFPAGIYENYMEGKQDNTHLHCEGAVKMAGLVAEGLKELGGIYAELLE